MTDSIELLLGDDDDYRIRSDWNILADANLPSQADHTGTSNRPHVTMATAARISPHHDVRLQVIFGGLPILINAEGLLVLGNRQRGFVLARAVAPSPQLVKLQVQVAGLLAGPVPPSQVGRSWLPHITLARRMTEDQLVEALTLVEASGFSGRAVSARRWEHDTRTVTPLNSHHTSG